MKQELKLVTADEFKAHLAKGSEMEEFGLIKDFVGDVKRSKGNPELTLDFVISTGDVDRDRDTIDVKGWDLKAFRKNPVVLFGHNSNQPPIAKSTHVGLEGDLLVASAEFTPKDLNPFGFMIFRMFEERFMRATSVGFRPTKFAPAPEDDEKRMGGIDFHKQELLEWSAVPVPANSNALGREASTHDWLIRAHTAGIDTAPLKLWAEEILDGQLGRGLSRTEVESAWKAVSERPFIIEIPKAPKPTTKSKDDDAAPPSLGAIREAAYEGTKRALEEAREKSADDPELDIEPDPEKSEDPNDPDVEMDIDVKEASRFLTEFVRNELKSA